MGVKIDPLAMRYDAECDHWGQSTVFELVSRWFNSWAVLSPWCLCDTCRRNSGTGQSTQDSELKRTGSTVRGTTVRAPRPPARCWQRDVLGALRLWDQAPRKCLFSGKWAPDEARGRGRPQQWLYASVTSNFFLLCLTEPHYLLGRNTQ